MKKYLKEVFFFESSIASYRINLSFFNIKLYLDLEVFPNNLLQRLV